MVETNTYFILYKLLLHFYNFYFHTQNYFFKQKMWDYLKNTANNIVMDASKYIYAPPETDQF